MGQQKLGIRRIIVLSYTVMTIATDELHAVIENIYLYMSQQKFRYKGESFHQKIFHKKWNNMYIYVEKNETSVILRIFISKIFIHQDVYKRQISRRFSWLAFGFYSSAVSRICRGISFVVSEFDNSAEIQVEDKKEWYPVMILK